MQTFRVGDLLALKQSQIVTTFLQKFTGTMWVSAKQHLLVVKVYRRGKWELFPRIEVLYDGRIIQIDSGDLQLKKVLRLS